MVVALVLLAPAARGRARSQASGDEPGLPAVVETLLGSWEGEGTLFGNDAEFSMHWEPLLDDGFVRLRFSNRLVSESSVQPILSAEAIYRIDGEDALSGVWFDTRGLMLPLRATLENGKLVTSWGGEDTEQGVTSYEPLDDGGVRVVDFVREPGGLREFGRAIYTRSEAQDRSPGR